MRNFLKAFFSISFVFLTLFLPLNQMACAADEVSHTTKFIPVEVSDDTTWSRMSYEKKTYQIGSRILKANDVQQRFGFVVKRYASKDPNASVDFRDNRITIERSLFRYIDSDDELAAILSHEIAHAEHMHYGERLATSSLINTFVMAPLIGTDVVLCMIGVPSPFFTILGTRASRGLKNKSNQKYETEADLRGIDLMVKAGYNPLAMESILGKISGDGLTIFPDHPKGTVRIDDIHSYIAIKYPQFLTKTDDKQDKVVTPVSNVSPKTSTDSTTQTVQQSDVKAQELPAQNDKSTDSTQKAFNLSNTKDEVSDFDYVNDAAYLPYLKTLKSKVLKNWYPPNNGKNQTAVMNFTVNNIGSLVTLKISQSSEDEIFDNAAINAIKKSAPFGKFPEKVSSNQTEISFSFVKETPLSKDPYVLMNLKTKTIHKIGCRLSTSCGESCIKLRRSEALKKGGHQCKICGG